MFPFRIFANISSYICISELQGCIFRICVCSVYNPQANMCEEPCVSLKRTLHSLANRVPKIVLQRVEEIYPGVLKSVVSVVQKPLLPCCLSIYLVIEQSFVADLCC